MKHLLILEPGISVTMMENYLYRIKYPDKWTIDILDDRFRRFYQSGHLFLPNEIHQPKIIGGI
jgi:hypothetical protein